MQIKPFTNGFEEIIDSDVVQKIVSTYDGLCKIYFRDGKTKCVTTNCTAYNSQFGIPTSLDGQIMFVSSWENGLTAYNVDSNSKRWCYKSTRIRSVYVYQTYVVALKYGESIIKFDINNGKKLGELRSGTLEFLYELCAPFVLANTFRGKLSVINTETMSIEKIYQNQKINPSKAISFLIQKAAIERNKLVISGLENQKPFNRIIDTAFIPYD